MARLSASVRSGATCGSVGAGDRQPDRLGAGREQERVVGETRVPLVERQPTARPGRSSAPRVARSAARSSARRRTRRRAAGSTPRARCRRGSPSRGSADRPGRRRRAPISVIAPGVALPAQRLGRHAAGGARADDHDRARQAGARAPRPGRRRPARPPTNSRPPRRSTWQQASGVSAGRAPRSPVRKLEAGVVPRAAHRAVDDDALGERRRRSACTSRRPRTPGRPARASSTASPCACPWTIPRRGLP